MGLPDRKWWTSWRGGPTKGSSKINLGVVYYEKLCNVFLKLCGREVARPQNENLNTSDLQPSLASDTTLLERLAVGLYIRS